MSALGNVHVDLHLRKYGRVFFHMVKKSTSDQVQLKLRNNKKSRLSMIVRVNVVLNRTVVVDSD